jgi:prepilin-type N-terminal cleavage/methylation domain-containing protein
MDAAKQANRRSGGFTLIELMITVALIGILAAIAVTSFQLYQLRSKRSEALVNLGALRKAQLAYFHEAGGFVPCAPSPALAGYPWVDKQNWPPTGGFSSTPGLGFDVLGWQPEGPTYFDYDTNAQQGANGWYFTAAAYGDTDGDGNYSAFLYVYPDSTGATLTNLTGPTFFNFPFNPHTCAPILNTVGQVPAVGGCGSPPADDY